MITPEEKLYLLGEMKKLLQEYEYDYNTYALETIIDEWATQKASLIEAFKRHPNYIEGKFMIAFDYDYTREIDLDGVVRFAEWLKRGPMVELRDSLPECIDNQTRSEGCWLLPSTLFCFLSQLYIHIDARTIAANTASLINKMLPEVHAHDGQKSSRVVNKICTYLGYSKHPDYNKEFAKFADSLSPMTIKRHTILSLNPLDYLTMSFGNSWASCHTIDKDNLRGMPNSYEGQYSSGTISYMLDPSSMVLYTVASEYDGNEYYTQPKIVRQMFHWGEDKLIQGRLYPQDNDDNKEAYTPYRNFVQEVMATIMDIPNLWVVKRGYDIASRYVLSHGTHYRDYAHYNNCTLSTPKDIENTDNVIIGANPICIECGCRHDYEENINHCTASDGDDVCAHCGCIIDTGVYLINDETYCADCVTRCDVCGEYHLDEDIQYIHSTHQNVCEHCIDRYFVYCDECEAYYPEEDVRYVEATGCYVCYHCFTECYTTCPVCGVEHYIDEGCPNACEEEAC